MKFLVVLEPDPEVGGYNVTVPALPGCFTQGDTEEEALANAREAIECWFPGGVGTLRVSDWLAKANEPLEPPSVRDLRKKLAREGRERVKGAAPEAILVELEVAT